MRLEREVHWPCGFQRRDAIRAWKWPKQLPISTDCPLHGHWCPVPIEQPLRKALKELHSWMYEVDHGDLLDRLEELIADALGPWKLPGQGEEESA